MAPQVSKCTAILIVNEVEPCVDFWVERLGFTKTVEVPHEGAIGFAIVAQGGVEIMYQSLASVQVELGEATLTRSALFLDVDDIDQTIACLAGVEVVMGKRDTFYGTTEYWVREPAGNLVGFAQMKKG